ncbi:MAG: diacylglycerol kinase [Chitinophagaceae bacterium]|nr:diacylglycerol kinase [Chitinophagaceae bacterium]MBK8953794.1 diacylglycerol kinase [Chitinophagaceae bacterium]
MSRYIIYIINPVSGTKGKQGLQQLVEQKTRAAGIPFKIFPSVASGDYSFLHPVIKEEGVTDIVIAGGDGTISPIVNSLMPFDVNFGIIPCGSGNGLAFAAKIPKQQGRAIDLVLKGSASPVDGYTINGRFACMLAGLGFDAKVAHDFAQQPTRGLSTYIKQVVKNFFSARVHAFGIELPQYSFTAAAYFISIANGNQFGNNFTIAPKASLCDGLLDVVMVTKQNKLSVLLQTLRQITGNVKLQPATTINNKKGVVYFQTNRIKIDNAGLAPLHIDGDPAETAAEITIIVKEKCYRLIQP